VGDPTIRAARADDAPQIAEIQVRSWRWAYQDLLPAAFLAALSIDRRAAFWRQWLADPRPRRHLWLATDGTRAVGFAATGPSRDATADADTGELWALYLDPAAVGTGIGRALYARAETGLRDAGFRSATLWVIESNRRGRRFYERQGWRVDGGEKAEEWSGQAVREVRYRRALPPEGSPALGP
jgi:GNAT superfamily N-acetyltransferase